MSTRAAARLAQAIALCSLALVAASLILLILDSKAIDSIGTSDPPFLLNAVIAAVLGALIASRRPRNPIGWLLLAISMSQAVSMTGAAFAVRRVG